MAGPKRYPMTPRGYQILQARIRQIKEFDRPANVAAIEVAREHGDLKENAEYQYEKEKQGMLNAQLIDAEARLSLAEVIDPAKLVLDRVAFGATVEVIDLGTDEERTYQIVGTSEADAAEGRISYDSPLARALMGREEGDVLTFEAPGGKRKYEVVGVEYK